MLNFEWMAHLHIMNSNTVISTTSPKTHRVTAASSYTHSRAASILLLPIISIIISTCVWICSFRLSSLLLVALFLHKFDLGLQYNRHNMLSVLITLLMYWPYSHYLIVIVSIPQWISNAIHNFFIFWKYTIWEMV